MQRGDPQVKAAVLDLADVSPMQAANVSELVLVQAGFLPQSLDSKPDFDLNVLLHFLDFRGMVLASQLHIWRRHIRRVRV